MNQNTYTIPEVRRSEVQKEIARYEKKAARYGKTLKFEFSDPYAKEIPVYATEWDGRQKFVNKWNVEVFDLTINSESIKQDGFTVAARIEHLEGGNIVYSFGEERKTEWSHINGICEHCGTQRFRKVTYIVKNGDEEKQVGKSCLKDYCGIDPQRLGWSEQITEIILDDYDVRNCNVYGLGENCKAYDPIKILAYAISFEREQGYRKADLTNSNKDKILEKIKNDEDPSDEELKEAQAMADQIDKIEKDDATRFLLDDMQTFIRSKYCRRSHVGKIAYIPTAFKKYEDELKRREARKQEQIAETSSEYVGEIGERLTISIQSMRLVTSWETQWGQTYLYKFLGTDGNVFVWFASSPMYETVKDEKDESLSWYKPVTECKKIKATVKDHNERDGVKQTIITRVKKAN